MKTRPPFTVKVDLRDYPCPACGRSDRWTHIVTEERIANNPALLVSCDCGAGELKIIVE